MSMLSIPAVVMASISLYVGLYHLLIYLRRRQQREDLTFALTCLATGLYDVFCAGLYSATSVAEGAQWQRVQFIALAFFTTAFLWFVSDYTHQKPQIATYAFSAFFLLALLIQIVDRSSLTWMVDRPSVKEILLPLDLKITYYEATFGPFTTLQSLMGLVASTYILWSGVRFYRRGYQREAVPLLLALGFVYAAAVNDTAVSNGLYQFVYAIEYAYMAMILLMAYSLSNMVVEAAMAKEALRESEERFRSLVETTSDWVWETDRNGVYTYVSPKITGLLGYEPEEMIGKTPFDLMPPDEAKHIGAIFRDIVTSQRPIERLENTARRKDGELVVLETSGVPFLDANGELLGYRGIDRDITERKQAEEVLRESEERHRSLFENSPISLWEEDFSLIKEYFDDLQAMGDTDFRAFFFFFPEAVAHCAGLVKVMDVNKATVALMGARDKDELLAGLSKVLVDEALVVFREELITLAEGGQRFESEVVHRTLSGEERFIALNLSVAPGSANSLGKVLVSVLDITERRRAEEALRESEQKYRFITEKMTDTVWLMDMEFKPTFISPSVTRTLGYTLEELQALSLDELLTPESFEFAMKTVATELSPERLAPRPYERSVTVELEFRRKDGSPLWSESTIALLRDSEGRPTGLMGVGRDITERKRAEEALQESEATLRSVFRAAPIGIGLVIDRVFQWTNETLHQMLGYTAEELEGQSARMVYPSQEEYERVGREKYADIAERGTGSIETRFQRKDGEIIDVLLSSTPLDPSDLSKGVTFTALDITERKQAEEALHESEERYRRLAEAAHDMIFILNREGNVDYVNSFATQQLGRLPEEIIGRSHAELFLSDDAEHQQARLRQVFEAGQPLYVENLTRFPNQRMWLGTWLVPIKDEAGQVKSVLGVSRDITERKQAEEEIQRLNAELEQRVVERTAQLEAANKELEAFSYSVSHDLRAPLRAIDGYTRILVEDYKPCLDAEGQRVCAVVRDQTQRMGQLIDDLLAFSRLSRADMQPRPVDMETLANSVFHDLTTPADRERIDFRVEPLPPAVGDPILIRQVWMNLLSNAVKFSSIRARAVIEVGSRQDASENTYTVRDNGAGFDMQYAGKLFGVFQRLHSEREFEGTGVGLAIVQRVIHRHGGRVWAEGEVDKGATFYFTLPRKGD